MKALFLKTRSLQSLKLEKELNLKAGESIYFMGICGTAMASLAVYLKQEGFVISGSDQDIYPPMSLVLKKESIPIFEYSADNIQNKIKLIIVGNVISSSHVEIQKAKALDIPVLSLPEFLQQSLLSHTKNIVIAGTHGKSTSAALMAHIAETAGQNPGFFIGGFPYDFNSSFRAGALQNSLSKAGRPKTNSFPPDASQKRGSHPSSSQADSSKAIAYKEGAFQTAGPSEGLSQKRDSEYFVIEGDEYDTSFFAKRAKFFYYNPRYVVLTGIEFDHADIYKDLEEIQQSFSKFLSAIPKQGALAACIESDSVKKLLRFCKAPVLTYGIGKGDFQIQKREILTLRAAQSGAESAQGRRLETDNSQDSPLSKPSRTYHTLKKLQRIEILGPDKKTYQLLTPLLGWHNALNVLGVFILAKHLQWEEDQVLKALESFKGLKRRLEFRFKFQGTDIFEDFAHHPTAIQAGLSALKESYPEKRLLALFEPRSFTARSDFFQKDYISSFQPADLIFIVKPYQSPKQKTLLSVQKLIEDLKKKGKRAFYCKDFQQLEREFKRQAKKEDLAVFMSSGAFGSILERLSPLKA